jgi:ribonuclease P protein component
VLASRNRIRRSDDFTVAVRRGRRAGRAHLVLHLAVVEGSLQAPRVGFVVSKAVGGAVVRNTVTRRLRPIVRERIDRLPAGSLLVVRALPASAGASSEELRADVDAALDRVLR